MKKFLNLSNCILAICLLIFIFVTIIWFIFFKENLKGPSYLLFPLELSLIIAFSFFAILLIGPTIGSMIRKKENFKEYLPFIMIVLFGLYFSYSFFSGLIIAILIFLHFSAAYSLFEIAHSLENIARSIIVGASAITFSFIFSKSLQSFSEENSFK